MKFKMSPTKTLLFILAILFIFFLVSFNRKEKLILVAIDGADWKVINLLISKNKLPTFKKFIEKGSYGTLVSPYSYSPVTWTEIATSETGEKNGIQDFFTADKSRFAMSYDVKSPRVWNYLSDVGINVGVYKYFVTYPAEQVKGFMISSPPLLVNGSFYPVHLGYSLLKINFPRIVSPEITQECDEVVNLFLLFKPNFLTFYENRIHIAEHSYWKFLFPRAYNITSQTEVPNDFSVIEDAYGRMDNCLSLLERKAPYYDIIIVSDHGMHDNIPIQYELDFKNLLRKMGLLAENSFDSSSIVEMDHYIVSDSDKDYRISLKVANASNIKLVKERLSDIYYLSGSNLFTRITNTSNEVFVSMNRTLFDESLLLMSGPTDLYFYYSIPVLIRSSNTRTEIFVWEKSGEHTSYPKLSYTNGIVIAKGPSFRENFFIPHAIVYDITPTILYLFGFQQTQDMQGNVLKDAINSQTVNLVVYHGLEKLESLPVHYVTSSEVPHAAIQEQTDALKKLGYIN